jgi:hypothetical protein
MKYTVNISSEESAKKCVGYGGLWNVVLIGVRRVAVIKDYRTARPGRTLYFGSLLGVSLPFIIALNERSQLRRWGNLPVKHNFRGVTYKDRPCEVAHKSLKSGMRRW